MVQNSPTLVWLFRQLDLAPPPKFGVAGGGGKRKEPVGRLEFPPSTGDDIVTRSNQSCDVLGTALLICVRWCSQTVAVARGKIDPAFF